MPNIFSNNIDLVTILLSCIAFVVWLVRLEGKVGYAQKSIDELTIRHNNLDSELVKKLTSLETSIARIEGYLKAKNEGE